jgi:hypothetical protein
VRPDTSKKAALLAASSVSSCRVIRTRKVFEPRPLAPANARAPFTDRRILHFEGSKGEPQKSQPPGRPLASQLLHAIFPVGTNNLHPATRPGRVLNTKTARSQAPNFSPPAIGFRRIYRIGILFERVHRSAGYYCNRWSGTQFPAPCGATFLLQRAIASFQGDETPRSGGTKIPLRGSERDPAFLASDLPAHRLFKTEFTTVSLRFSAALAREL